MENKEESIHLSIVLRALGESAFERVLTLIPRIVLDILTVLGLSWFKGLWNMGRPATLAIPSGKRQSRQGRHNH